MKIISWDDFISSRNAHQSACSDIKTDASPKRACSDGQIVSSPVALTIGVFDGIHIGHRLLLDDVIFAKTNHGYQAGIVTFTDSIFTFFKQAETPLQSLDERLKRFESLGFDFVILIDFTKEIASMQGTDFLKILKEKCGLKYLVEGEDFRFGDGGKTSMAEIKSFCEKNDIEVKFIPPVMFEGERVSSSMIRDMQRTGKSFLAKKLLSDS